MSMTEFCILNQYCVFDRKNDVKIDYKILKQHAKHDFWKIRGENAMNTNKQFYNVVMTFFGIDRGRQSRWRQ